MKIVLFLVPAAVSALLAFVLTPFARALAARLGVVDEPGPRKVHSAPVPRLGGIAVVVAVATVLGTLAAIDLNGTRILSNDVLQAIAIGLAPILVVSLIDDVRPLRAVPKFIVHLAGAAATVTLGVQLGESIHMFGQEMHIGWLAIPISIVWLAGTTNAFNLVDGLDGLSAGLALISAVSLAAVSIVAQRYEMAAAAAVLAGALAGFLPYNTYPAKVYLGDTGATAIGFFLGALTLRGGSTATAGLAIMVPILVVGVPVAETLLSIIRRTVRRIQGTANSILDADRDHIHHRLLALGYTQKRAVLLLYGIGVTLALSAFASVFVNAQNAALLLVTLFAAAMVGIAKLGYDEFALIRSGAVLRVYDKPVLKTGFFVVFVDLALVVTAIYAAIVLKYDDWGVRDHRSLAINLLTFGPAMMLATFATLGIYRRSWGNANIEDLERLSIAVVIASVGAMILVRLLTDAEASLTYFVVYAVMTLGVMNGSRASYRILHHWNRRSNQEGQPVLIYGAGLGGMLAAREMLDNEDVMMKPIGFIDDDPLKQGRIIHGLPVLGDLGALENVVMGNGANGVVIASEKIPIHKIGSAKRVCERNGVWLTYFEVTFRRSVKHPGVARRSQGN